MCLTHGVYVSSFPLAVVKMPFLLGTSNRFLYLFPFEVSYLISDNWLIFVIYQKLKGKGGKCDELKKLFF